MWREAFRYFLAVCLFLAVSSAFFWPYLDGQRISQPDLIQYQGMSQEIRSYREMTGRTPLWTNAMFCGMPTYQINTAEEGNYLKYISRALMLTRENPIGLMFTAMVCMFVLLVILRVDFSIAMIGAVMFGLTTNNILLYEVGHISKLRSVSFLPLIMATIVLAYRGQYVWGFFCFALGLGLNLLANHIQMTYYFFLTIPIYLVAVVRDSADKHHPRRFAKASLVLMMALLVSLGTATSNLWPTYEYAEESTRGGAIVSSPQSSSRGAGADQGSGGLSWEYAMEWSNGALDLLACVIPGAAGNSSQARLFRESTLYQALVLEGASENEVHNAPLYWGALPYTDGPQYQGIVLVFFFVLGLLIMKDPIKWWAGLGMLLITVLSLGDNLSLLNEFVFRYVPLYNKFRTPNSILSVAPLMIVSLALLALSRIIQTEDKGRFWPVVRKVGVRFISVLILLLLLGPYVLDFESRFDIQHAANGLNLENLRADRRYLFKYDTTRALLLLVLALFLLWAYLHDHLSRMLFILVLGVLTLVDFWTVNRRFIDSASFEEEKETQVPFEARDVDRQILADTSAHFRILDLSINTFNTASSSFFHKTLGGYHAAKLRRYQDIIDWYLARGDRGVINMLNAKYIIQTDPEGNPHASVNEGALGNAWAVDSIKMAEDHYQELAVIDSIDPGNIAVIHKDFTNYLAGLDPDPSGRISLTNYAPDFLIYSTQSYGEMLVVFSEVWYNPDKGWQAFIDDQPVEHIRANYILRAIRVPPGKHEIKFVFEPHSFYTGRIISKISSSFILYGFIWLVGVSMYRSRFPRSETSQV